MAIDLDFETFLSAWYVIVDALYQRDIHPRLLACGGPAAQMRDSEVLCLGLAGQWRSGVPWQSERGILRYVRKHLSHLLPTVLTQRACNRRLRRLWGACILRQDAVATPRAHGESDLMDGCPIPVAHGARAFTAGWLADIARNGTGGNDRYFYGVRLMMVIQQEGVATGWVLGSGNVQERWVAELLCSSRAGVPGGQGPLDDKGQTPQRTPPQEWMAAVPSGGAASQQPLLRDGGFRGDDWLAHWAKVYGVQVCPLPKAAPRAQRHWWSSARQGVETTCANLSEGFGASTRVPTARGGC